MIGLIVLLLFCMGVAFMFLMACVNPNDPSMLGVVARFVTITAPKHVGNTIRSVPFVGPLCLDGGYQLFNYVAFKPNPLLQSVYAVLVFGGYGCVLWQAYPQIPNLYMAGYHRYIGVFVVGGTLWAWYKSCSVSPGYITAENYKEFDNYPVDRMMYQPDQFYTYKDVQGNVVRQQIPKLPRSKHDAITNKVVARFDHFCPWLNNAVGERNYKYFLLFLFMTAFMLFYGTAATFSVVATYVTEEKLFSARYVNKVTGEIITASKHMVFQYCMHKQQTMMMLLFLCGIMGIVVFCFFLYHIYLVSINRTTNEGFKWSRYVGDFEYHERRRVYAAKQEEKAKVTVTAAAGAAGGGEDEPAANDSTNSTNTKKSQKRKKKGMCPQPLVNFCSIWLHGCFIVTCGACGVEEREENANENDQVYDFSDKKFKLRRPGTYFYRLRSFRENLMEVLYPRSLRSKEERDQLVTWTKNDGKKNDSGNQSKMKKKKKQNKATKKTTPVASNGNWTYHNQILMEVLAKSGEGAKIEMVTIVHPKKE